MRGTALLCLVVLLGISLTLAQPWGKGKGEGKGGRHIDDDSLMGKVMKCFHDDMKEQINCNRAEMLEEFLKCQGAEDPRQCRADSNCFPSKAKKDAIFVTCTSDIKCGGEQKRSYGGDRPRRPHGVSKDCMREKMETLQAGTECTKENRETCRDMDHEDRGDCMSAFGCVRPTREQMKSFISECKQSGGEQKRSYGGDRPHGDRPHGPPGFHELSEEEKECMKGKMGALQGAQCTKENRKTCWGEDMDREDREVCMSSFGCVRPTRDQMKSFFSQCKQSGGEQKRSYGGDRPHGDRPHGPPGFHELSEEGKKCVKDKIGALQDDPECTKENRQTCRGEDMDREDFEVCMSAFGCVRPTREQMKSFISECKQVQKRYWYDDDEERPAKGSGKGNGKGKGKGKGKGEGKEESDEAKRSFYRMSRIDW